MLKGTRILGALFTAVVFCRAVTVFADDAKTDAARHFEAGVSAFEHRRYAEAGEQFEAAYRAAPAYAVLFNIGQVNVILGRSVQAVAAFEKYLAEGGSAIPAGRRAQVEQELERQRARIGSLALEVEPEGAQLRIDGRVIGQSPTPEPVRLASGRHVIETSLAGYVTDVREVEIAPGSAATLAIGLAPAAAAQSPAPVPPSTAISEAGPATDARPAIAASPAAQTESARTAPLEPDAARESGPSAQRIAGYSLMGFGLASAIVGGVVAGAAAGQAHDAEDRASHPRDPAEWESASSDFESAKDRNQTGWIVAGAGAAALAGGLVLVLTARTPEHDRKQGLGLWLDDSTAGVWVQRRW
ncbi:MAG: PEGA domain-containing protein [Polyangiaceae bacterium]|nr:PEGA domain-containing protein [Polyangiaceae bacterium]